MQPQKPWPARLPRFAIRFVISEPHTGHSAAADTAPDGNDDGTGFNTFTVPAAGEVDAVFMRACRSMAESLAPSINSILRPLANAFASFVNYPDVTTNPPAAPWAAITPYNSRTVVTLTFSARQCLHCTKNRSRPFARIRSIPSSPAILPVSSTR